MSIKNIALDSQVYRRLAAYKKESESFSRAIARILDEVESAHTGADVIGRLAGITGLEDVEAERMLEVVEVGRRDEGWEPHDLR